jgi:hypothetical protein
MKSLNKIRIALLFLGLFISYQLASKEAAIHLNEKYNTVTISQLNQTDEVVKIAVTNELGKDPGFDGLKVLLSKLKVKVEKKLRGNIPYRIKSTIKDGTIIPIRIGNELRLEVTLFKCEESSRHWFFEAAAGIYSYNNNPSMGPITSAVKLKVMEKARSSSFPSQQILGLFPSHISLVGFSNLNSGDPNKEYKAVFEFLTAQRPADYVEVVHNDVIDPDSDEFSENTNQELVYLPNNLPDSRQVNSDYLVSKKESISTASAPINLTPKIPESPFYKYLNDGDRKLLIKILTNEINIDPKGFDDGWGIKKKICGKASEKCEWCGKNSLFVTYYNSNGELIKMLNHNTQKMFLIELNTNNRDGVRYINEMKKLLNLIRNKQYYTCLSDSKEKFCSLKCKLYYEHHR